jgi:glycosyltransferase involved in cell wall biosynthesis
MNILFDYEIFTRQRFGGISRYFHELISRMSRYDEVNIDLFMGINNSAYDFSSTSNGIKVVDHKFKGADKLHFLVNLVNGISFKKYINRNKCDLFHKTYYSNVGLNLSTIKITTVHDMTHEIYPLFFAKGDNTSELKKKCINESNGIICVSQSTKNDLLNMYHIDEKHVKVIYHGISINNYETTPRIIEEPYILYVGQRWGYKNFNLLLTAYNHIDKLKNNFKIVCFGGGKFNLSEKLYIIENDLSDKVIYLDGGDSVLASLYKNAELFVYTSFYEGFGFPPLEAMKCGCPVLSSKAGSVIEIAGEACLYFDPFNKDELIHKLQMLLEDSGLRNDLINRGNSRCKSFTWDRCVEEHLSFYKEIQDNYL